MRVFTLLISLLLVLMVVSARGETKAEQIQKKVTETIDIRHQTQKKEDIWAGKKAELMARYRSLSSERENLEKLKARIEHRLNIQKNLVAEAERRTKESQRIREELQSCLESIVTQIEEFIRRDLPFLPKERSDRLASIKETLARPDKTASEKLRRVMEALQVEAEYGRTVEVYQDTIDLDGQSVLVDIVRLGRLSLFCQTPDSKMVGHYDRAIGKWVLLSPGYRRNVNKAVVMVRRERTIDLVTLPIGRISVP